MPQLSPCHSYRHSDVRRATGSSVAVFETSREVKGVRGSTQSRLCFFFVFPSVGPSKDIWKNIKSGMSVFPSLGYMNVLGEKCPAPPRKDPFDQCIAGFYHQVLSEHITI